MKDIIVIRANKDERFEVCNLLEHKSVSCDNWQQAKDAAEEMLQYYVWHTRVVKRNDSKK